MKIVAHLLVRIINLKMAIRNQLKMRIENINNMKDQHKIISISMVEPFLIASTSTNNDQ